MPADMQDYFRKKEQKGFSPEPPQFLKDFGKKAGLVYLIIIIAVLLVIAKPFSVINSGEVGIMVTAGKYDPIALEPGIHFFIPGIQKIITVDTKVRIINYSSTEERDIRPQDGVRTNPAISVLDSRGLPVSIDLTVQYRLKPIGAPQTIATWGIGWEDKIINPVARDVVRSVIGRYTAEELPIKRNEIALMIENDIRAKIEKLENQPVELLSVQLRAVLLPEKIKEQIERVQIARQETERARYEVEKAKQEAEKKAALARGDAEAKKIQAQGEYERITIEAKAQAQANEQIAASLTDRLLRLRQIEVQNEFNKALQQNRDAKIFLTPAGSTPHLWIDSKDEKKAAAASEQ